MTLLIKPKLTCWMEDGHHQPDVFQLTIPKAQCSMFLSTVGVGGVRTGLGQKGEGRIKEAGMESEGFLPLLKRGNRAKPPHEE